MATRHARLLPLLLLFGLAPVGACVQRQAAGTLSVEIPPTTVDGAEPYLMAHMLDGSVYDLRPWRPDTSEGAAVRGRGRVLGPNRRVLRDGDLVVPLDSVALFETNVLETSSSVAALAVMTGITAGVTAVCLANPKSCFGSCPTFWVTDGSRDRLQAEGFSASVAPVLEATDVDALLHARPRGETLEVRMTNEALETHVVRHVRLRVVPRPAGGRVFAAVDGTYRPATGMAPPDRCAAPEGDCADLLREADGRERFGRADSTDLAARETIEIAFDRPPAGPLGLVLVSRQTLLSTYLLYQALAWMGTDATRRLAALERGVPGALRGAGGVGRALGGIEVSVSTGEGWRPVGEPNETGPLAADAKMLLLPPLDPGPVRIRLRATRGHWRIDHVALARVGPAVEPVVLDPVAVLVAGRPDEDARARLLDPASVLVTRPGDAYTLVFPLPGEPDRHEYLLESRGYYLEWMRSEWIAEEDPARAAGLFLDPRGTLRELAPAYGRAEPRMEQIFWSSRYAAPR